VTRPMHAPLILARQRVLSIASTLCAGFASGCRLGAARLRRGRIGRRVLLEWCFRLIHEETPIPLEVREIWPEGSLERIKNPVAWRNRTRSEALIRAS